MHLANIALVLEGGGMRGMSRLGAGQPGVLTWLVSGDGEYN